MLFVVRITPNDEREPDYKAYESLGDAQARFDRAWGQTREGEFRNSILFRVSGTQNAREAIELVKAGNTDRVIIMDKTISFREQLEKNPIKLDL